MKLKLITQALSSIAKIPLLGQVITGILGIITGVITARSTGKQERKNDLRKCRPYFKIKFLTKDEVGNLSMVKHPPLPCRLKNGPIEKTECKYLSYLKIKNIAPYSCYDLVIHFEIYNKLLDKKEEVICDIDSLSSNEEKNIDYLSPCIEENKKKINNKDLKNKLRWAIKDTEKMDILEEYFSLKNIKGKVSGEIKAMREMDVEEGLGKIQGLLIGECIQPYMYHLNVVKVTLKSEQLEDLEYHFKPIKIYPSNEKIFKLVNQEDIFKK